MEEEKDGILKTAQKIETGEYAVSWDEKGKPLLKEKKKVAEGKKSKKKGLDFESKVRVGLEEKGWIVSKWPNQVDLLQAKIIPAKQSWKFNPFRKMMMPSAQGTGFPDFIAFQKTDKKSFNVIGVEVKVNGQLDREEKEKCAFLIENEIFNDIIIAKKKNDSREIEYVFFREKYLKEKDINLE
jgi:hypothetical protein